MTGFKLSENRDNNKVFLLNRSELEKRFDPFYYIPELSELEKKVSRLNPEKLRHYVLSIGSGATPKTTKSEKYYSDKEKGIPFLRVQNLSPTGILEFDDCKYINHETHNNYLKRSQVKEGDLLVKITGVGRMAVSSIAPDGFIGNTNQHMVVIRTGDKKISEIIAAYLNTDIGEKLASRRATGGTRPALDYSALLSMQVVYNEKILEISKNAVSKKQELETQAQQLLASIDKYLLNELGITLPEKDNSLKNRVFTTKFSEVSGGRFDPKLYDNYTQSLRKAIKNCSFTTALLKSFIVQSITGDWGIDENKNAGQDFSKCLVIRATEFDNQYNLNLDNTRVKFRLIHNSKLTELDILENDLLIEKSGGSSDQPVGRISILTKEILGNNELCYSNFIHKIRVEGVNPVYLFCFLKTVHNIKLTDAMQSQTSGIRNLIMSNYFNQSIPVPPLKKQNEIAKHIEGSRTKAKRLQEEAKQEIENAKQEIEKMILS